MSDTEEVIPPTLAPRTLTPHDLLGVIYVGVLSVLEKCVADGKEIVAQEHEDKTIDRYVLYTLESFVKMLLVMQADPHFPVPTEVTDFYTQMGWSQSALLGPLEGLLSVRPEGSSLH